MTKNPDCQTSAQAGTLERAGQGACRNCRLVEGAYSWKQMVGLTACIMGVLAALGAALVAILKVMQG